VGFEDAARSVFLKRPAAKAQFGGSRPAGGPAAFPTATSCRTPARAQSPNGVLPENADTGRISADRARQARAPAGSARAATPAGPAAATGRPSIPIQVRADLEDLLGSQMWPPKANFLSKTHLDRAASSVVEQRLRRKGSTPAGGAPPPPAGPSTRGRCWCSIRGSGGCLAIAGGATTAASQFKPGQEWLCASRVAPFKTVHLPGRHCRKARRPARHSLRCPHLAVRHSTSFLPVQPQPAPGLSRSQQHRGLTLGPAGGLEKVKQDGEDSGHPHAA